MIRQIPVQMDIRPGGRVLIIPRTISSGLLRNLAMTRRFAMTKINPRQSAFSVLS
ncbi:MAG: hypothetical protein RL007_2431, partial [Bacteroidota bacterium]